MESWLIKIDAGLIRQVIIQGATFLAFFVVVKVFFADKIKAMLEKRQEVIEKDLAADLSPHLLAENQNVSLGYLSTVFRKETGKTLSEYIREKRVKHASHLLSTTRLQIQTVALHCGIMDVQYFSKIFKKQMGMTPKEYREFTKIANKI